MEPYENPPFFFFYYVNPITCAWTKRGQGKPELGYSNKVFQVLEVVVVVVVVVVVDWRDWAKSKNETG